MGNASAGCSLSNKTLLASIRIKYNTLKVNYKLWRKLHKCAKKIKNKILSIFLTERVPHQIIRKRLFKIYFFLNKNKPNTSRSITRHLQKYDILQYFDPLLNLTLCSKNNCFVRFYGCKCEMYKMTLSFEP